MNDLIKQVGVDTQSCITKSLDMIITNQKEYELASVFLKRIKDLQRTIKSAFDSIIEKAYQAHKEAVAQRAKYLDPVRNAEQRVKAKISDYTRECEHKQRAEQERLRLEAEEKANKERAKLDKRADKWEDKGNEKKAEQLREEASQIEAQVTVANPTINKVNGISTRKIWKARVVNFALLNDDYKLPNMQLLDSIARASKGKKEIQGIEYYTEEKVAVR